MEDTAAKHYHYLLQYHHSCQAAVRKVVAYQFSSPSGWYALQRFDWLVLPKMTALQDGNSLWPAILEKEVAMARKNGRNKYNFDWKAMLEAKTQIEMPVEPALQAVSVATHSRDLNGFANFVDLSSKYLPDSTVWGCG